jgi:hypothetical protein
MKFKQWLESNPFPTSQLGPVRGNNPVQWVPGKNSEKKQPPPLGDLTPAFPKNNRSFAKK